MTDGGPRLPATWINVKELGAKGDGASDDSPAILRAVSRAQRTAGGAVVFFPPGTFVLNSTLTITKPNVVLRGSGQGSTTVYIPSALSDVLGPRWQSDGRANKSSYAFMGGFVTIAGPQPSSSSRGSFLTAVPERTTVPQFARRLPVTNTTRISKGAWVRIFINDISTTGTCDHLGFCRRRRRQLLSTPNPGSTLPNYPGQIPPWAARLAGAAHADDSVQIAASSGSIADWVYGDGVCQKGPGNRAVDHDTMTFTAKVAAKEVGHITLDRPLPFPIRAGWRASVHSLVAPLQHSGVERLTVEFKWEKAKMHLQDRGFNAFQLEGVRNCWIRDVTILNADNGAHFHFVDHSLVSNLVVGVTRLRNQINDPHQPNGHHPLTLYHGHYNLITGAHINATYSHDITVARVTMLNVFSRCKGYNLNLDHHRGGPFGNLFSDIDLGCGLRPFGSSGLPENGAHAGRGEMFTTCGLRRRAARCPATQHPTRPWGGRCSHHAALARCSHLWGASGAPRAQAAAGTCSGWCRERRCPTTSGKRRKSDG